MTGAIRTSMRVSIDATPLLLRSAGVKTYFYHWLKHLARVRTDIDLDVFPRMPDTGSLDHEASQLSRIGTAWRLGLLLAANNGVPGAMRTLLPPCRLFHVTNQVRRPPANAALSATVHDMTCWLMPEVHTAANVRADREFADAVLRRARALIAVSENTRRDVVRLLRLDERRVEVIYPGVSEAYFRAAAAPEAKGIQTPGASRTEKPYVLFAGTIEPRKNLGRLLDAYLTMPASIRNEYELRIAGPAGWGSRELMDRLSAPPPGVRYLGYVPEAEMPALFAGASLLAYPSLYEGFGFPVAQALACGVPVLTANVSSLPEVAGPGGCVVDPGSVSEIAAALARLLTSPSERGRLAAAGAEHARRMFQWQDNAARSVRFFEGALA
ncbi:MAG: glycosyltransferase family 1 protein [Bryobacteraceae bacterium]